MKIAFYKYTILSVRRKHRRIDLSHRLPAALYSALIGIQQATAPGRRGPPMPWWSRTTLPGWRRTVLLWIFILAMATASAQQKKGLITPENLLRNWKVVVKGGTAMLTSEVPNKYIHLINDVNIPVWRPGMTVTVATRKMLSSHWEMGYKLEILQVRGSATIPGGGSAAMRTTGLGNNFTIGYVFRESWLQNPKTNYTLAYKVGSLSIDNRFIDRPNSAIGVPFFLSNVAVVTGLINEFTFNFNRKLSLMLSAEFNRSSDNAADVYLPHKLFYYSPNTVNNFINISVGISYQFGFIKNKFNNDPKNLPWHKRKR